MACREHVTVFIDALDVLADELERVVQLGLAESLLHYDLEFACGGCLLGGKPLVKVFGLVFLFD